MTKKNMTNRNILTDKQYESIVEEATVDSYDIKEDIVGFCTLIQDNVEFPFTAKVVGEKVKVSDVDCNGREVKAKCQKNGKNYEVNILDLEYDLNIKGWEYIEAYRRWL